jgi:hypothetical protein
LTATHLNLGPCSRLARLPDVFWIFACKSVDKWRVKPVSVFVLPDVFAKSFLRHMILLRMILPEDRSAGGSI